MPEYSASGLHVIWTMKRFLESKFVLHVGQHQEARSVTGGGLCGSHARAKDQISPKGSGSYS